ncbi:Patatin-like phospholipase [Planctomycetes bacterium K23_9]|uniref:Patatin-like phospholipase n=2 Tax=Stieleria marina TaxID=1930275 RepID=A0A517NQQ8_9BACT|nr:Patatin-like phospholipase [Planctomycetes bacterium K23_9]
MTRFQILAFDGGGIRGAFGLGFLQELESLTNAKVRDCFDMIAGTSTGGITALGLGIGLGGQELVEFYEESGRAIFTPRPPYAPRKRWLKPVYPWLKKMALTKSGNNIDHFFISRYCPHALRDALHGGFGDLRMKDISGPRIIAPSINLTAGCPYVFGTPHIPMHLPDAEIPVLDVLLATTAAPTYFPHHEMPNGCSYADGGLWAGSPGLLGLAEALRVRQLCLCDDVTPSFSTDEIFMLTIGTGTTQYSLTPPGGDAGALYWASRIADVMMSSQVQGLTIPLKFLLSDRVKSINFALPDDSWKLDAVDHMEEMFDLGRQAARENADDLSAMFLNHQAAPYVPAKSDSELGASDIGLQRYSL